MTDNPYRVVLAWPHRDLHPNTRTRHLNTTAVRKKAKADAGWAAKEAGWRTLPDIALDLHMTFHPPDFRRRDLDGMFAACKYQIDALSEVLNVDDSRFGYVIRKGQPTRGGAVVVVVRPGANAVPVAFEPAPVPSETEAGE